MRMTEEPDAVGAVDVRPREAVAMIEFQHARFRAPVTVLVDERAAAAIALEHFALDGVGDVARTPGLGHRGPRLAAHAKAFLLDLLEQDVRCLLEDRRQVSVGNPVAQQILRLPELVVARAACGELELERLLGERGDDGPALQRGDWWHEGERRRWFRRWDRRQPRVGAL